MSQPMWRARSASGTPRPASARGMRLPAWSATMRNGAPPPGLRTVTGAGSSAAKSGRDAELIAPHSGGKSSEIAKTCRTFGAENACFWVLALSWMTMPILTIRHLTSYHYRQPVAFGEHRMMLRPRDDGDQTVLEQELEITPRPSHIAWTRDRFGNHVATAHFAQRARELRFESRIRLDHAPVGFRAADIEPACPRLPVHLCRERPAEPRALYRPGVDAPQGQAFRRELPRRRRIGRHACAAHRHDRAASGASSATPRGTNEASTRRRERWRSRAAAAATSRC